VTGISDKTISELRILRACVKLLRVPEGITQALVSLARIGNFEIRMFRDHHAISGAGPLFWLELFDHSASASVDSFSCNEIEDAVVIFDNFVLRAADLNAASGSGGTDS